MNVNSQQQEEKGGSCNGDEGYGYNKGDKQQQQTSIIVLE